MFFGLLVLIQALSGTSVRASGTPELPYAARTRPYRGLGTTLRGDLRYLGMAGATLGLADSPIGASENPAGPAMTVRGLDIIVTENIISDELLQGGDTAALTSTQFGAVGPRYPWGFGISAGSTHGEGGEYQLPDTTVVKPEVTVREIQFSVSRVFWKERISLGAGLVLGGSTLSLAPGTETGFVSESGGLALGLRAGALVQLPRRWFVGASVASPMRLDPGLTEPQSSGGLGPLNFHQEVFVPWRGGLGLGWIPNRHFRAGASLRVAGPTPGTAPLSDDSRLNGETWGLQPSLGANYLFYERPGLGAELSVGGYLESTGVIGTASRPHITFSLLASPGIFFFGAGLDAARGYINGSIALGLDLIRTLAWQKIIPPNPPPSTYGGLLPSIRGRSDEGLPRPIAPSWKPGASIDLLKVGAEMPDRIEERLKETGRRLLEGPGKSLENLGEELQESVGGVNELLSDPEPAPTPGPIRMPRPGKTPR